MSTFKQTPLSFKQISQRVAVPFAIFSTVLFGLLLLSWVLLLPGFTNVEVSGSVRSIAELQEYEDALEIDIADIEHARDQLVMPLKGSLYEKLREQKRTSYSYEDVQSAVQQRIDSIAYTHPDSVVIESRTFDARERQFILSGDVRNVGPRSMTVLANLAEVLRDLPFVESLESPKFVRHEHPVHGMHSPFTFTFQLR